MKACFCCHQQIAENAQACPKCGHSFSTQKEMGFYRAIGIVALFLAIMGAVVQLTQ